MEIILALLMLATFVLLIATTKRTKRNVGIARSHYEASVTRARNVS